MSEIIYYLAHPWASNPEQSFQNAITWTQHLRQKGYAVFSPILHTHPYWKEITKKYGCDTWLAWDLTILDSFKECIILMSKTAIKTDYMHNYPFSLHYALCYGDVADGYKNWKDSWHSQGCRQEYEFAKTHGIPVYELEAFLKGEVVEL